MPTVREQHKKTNSVIEKVKAFNYKDKRFIIGAGIFVVLLVLLIVFVAFNSYPKTSSDTNADRKVTIKDMVGDEVTFNGPVNNVVDLWPAHSVSFIEFGAGNLLCGVASNSDVHMNSWVKHYFPVANSLPSLGSMPTSEELKKLSADLVIVNAETCDENYAKQLRLEGVNAVVLNYTNIDGMLESYAILGQIIGGDFSTKIQKWGADVINKMENRENELYAMNQAGKLTRTSTHYVNANNDSMISTIPSGTYIEELINACGGTYYMSDIGLKETDKLPVAYLVAGGPSAAFVGGRFANTLAEELSSDLTYERSNVSRNHTVYKVPSGFASWTDVCPELVFMYDYGLWKLHPDLAAGLNISEANIIKEVVTFYKEYSGIDVSEKQVKYMLDGLGPDGQVHDVVLDPTSN